MVTRISASSRGRACAWRRIAEIAIFIAVERQRKNHARLGALTTGDGIIMRHRITGRLCNSSVMPRR